jgi:Ca2+-binding RTX toxin-like protein
VFLDGPNVRTVYGDALPLTNDNYAHYGNTSAPPRESTDPLTGLMNGTVFHRGFRYSISSLDLAVMADVGVGTIQNDRFSVGLMKAFNGGAGTDTVDFLSATAGIFYSLAVTGLQASGGMGDVNLTNIENLIGSAYADTITGDDANNVLSGAGGNDTLSGGSGDDTLTGGEGVDMLTGGSGRDTFRDMAAGLNGDTLQDFGPGDRIIITDATAGGFNFSISGNVLSYTGGTIILGQAPTGRVVSVAFEGGVQLRQLLLRVTRIDEGTAETAAAQSPARALMGRLERGLVGDGSA